jgi:hypothetical protein
MPRPDPQPPDQRDTAWLLQTAMAWALTGAVMTVEHRPLWHGVGVVLLVGGLAWSAGWCGGCCASNRHLSGPRPG